MSAQIDVVGDSVEVFIVLTNPSTQLYRNVQVHGEVEQCMQDPAVHLFYIWNGFEGVGESKVLQGTRLHTVGDSSLIYIVVDGIHYGPRPFVQHLDFQQGDLTSMKERIYNYIVDRTKRLSSLSSGHREYQR